MIDLNLFAAFTRSYAVGPAIGRGAFARVFECTRKSDSKKLAVKAVLREFSNRIAEEQRALTALQGKAANVVELIEIIETDVAVLFVLELFDGRDVVSFLQADRAEYTEQRARFYVTQLLLGIKQCHDNGVIHKDISVCP